MFYMSAVDGNKIRPIKSLLLIKLALTSNKSYFFIIILKNQ